MTDTKPQPSGGSLSLRPTPSLGDPGVLCGAGGGASVDAQAGGSTLPSQPVIDRYCMECFAPSGQEDYCPTHLSVGVTPCEGRCGQRASVRLEGRDWCGRCANEGKPGEVRCGVCGKEIRPGDQTARLNFNLCHASCVEEIEEARYEEFVTGIDAR